MPDYRCPNCGVGLEEMNTKAGILFACPACSGAMISLAVLRRSVNPDAIRLIWQNVTHSQTPGPRLCPACEQHMMPVPATSQPTAPTLDVCRLCQMIWFDPSEYDAMPKPPPPPKADKPLSPEAKQALAMFRAEHAGYKPTPPNLMDWTEILSAIFRRL